MFEVGQRYRRRDLHARYGGQQQGGISTPRNHPIILLITGATGSAYGYHDGWEPDGGAFRYFGEGQVGDMQFIRGNRAIRDHAADGRELHLFEDVKGGFLRYVGEVTCAGYTLVENSPDVNGNPRQAIAFQLVPVQAIAEDVDSAESSPAAGTPSPSSLWTRPLDELRRIAIEAPQQRDPKEARRRVWMRSGALKVYVIRRANGSCEACSSPAPFMTSRGTPYLEPHHVRRVSDGGPDRPEWVIATCPNCHRRAHHGADAKSFNDGLKTKLRTLEAST